MYEVKVISWFSSAHRLRDYKGKCEQLHGHNWKVEVVVYSKKLNNIGIVIDFKELKNRLSKVLADLDHRDLNNLSYFKKVNPTSENIARYIHRQMELNLPFRVTVWESETACASYYKL